MTKTEQIEEIEEALADLKYGRLVKVRNQEVILFKSQDSTLGFNLARGLYWSQEGNHAYYEEVVFFENWARDLIEAGIDSRQKLIEKLTD